MKKRAPRAPAYRAIADYYRQQVFEINHQSCRSYCDCQDVEQEMWSELEELLGRPLTDKEREP